MADDAMTTAPGGPPAEDDPLVTVLFGYGRVRATDVSYIDGNTTFRGGIARDVPLSRVKAWRRANPRARYVTLPADADESEFAKAAGVTLATPARAAAILRSTPIHELIEALGPDAARQFADEVRRALPPPAATSHTK